MGNNQSLDLSDSFVTERQLCYACNLPNHPSLAACPFHPLCSDCQALSAYKEFSVCCLETLNQDKINLLRAELGLCIKCSKSVQSGKAKLCLCLLCEDCLEASIFQEETCSICSRRKNKSGYTPCGICYKFHPVDSTISHRGCSYFCKPCLKESFLNSLPGQKEFSLFCPSCRSLLDPQLIHKLVTNDHYEHLSFEFARIRSELEWCSNCESFSLEINTEGSVQTCKKCLVIYCKNCSRDLNNCGCDFDFENAVKILIYAKQFFTRCPSCSRPYIKDGNCAMVDCLNSKCRQKFCAECQTRFFTIGSDEKFLHKEFCRFHHN